MEESVKEKNQLNGKICSMENIQLNDHMVKQKNSVKKKNQLNRKWLNGKMVKWKNLVKQKNWLNGKIRLNTGNQLNRKFS